MRIDKLLSHTGFGTRKEVKDLLKTKTVFVNHQVVVDGKKQVDPETDVITVDNIPIHYSPNLYIMMNKPSGYECSHTPKLYPSVLELMDTVTDNLIIVGRLDVDTEGLLLITTDGTFSHSIIHGKKTKTKTYHVELARPFDTTFIPMLNEGVVLDNQKLKPASVNIISESCIHLSISEGKYHQVKRMMHLCQNEVTYLKRIKIGSVVLDEGLPLGAYRQLTQDEIDALLKE